MEIGSTINGATNTVGSVNADHQVLMPPIVAALGALAMVFAPVMFIFKRAAYRRCVRACGVISGLVERRGSSDNGVNVTYAPKISFKTVSGEQIEFISSVASYPAPGIGNSVSVIYDPNDPTNATLDGVANKYLPEIVIFSLGSMAVLIYVIQHWSVGH